MPLRSRKPTSPGRRFQTVSDFSEITRDRPERSLLDELARRGLLSEPFERAGLRFCSSLRRFAEAHGKHGLYHETITWAYLALVNERRDASPGDDFSAFAAANPDLFDKDSGVLLALYDRETLRSERARRVFLLPRRSPEV